MNLDLDGFVCHWFPDKHKRSEVFIVLAMEQESLVLVCGFLVESLQFSAGVSFSLFRGLL